MTTKEILTTFEAAKICHVSYNTIKNWIKRGLLDAYRTAGGHLRIRANDVESFCRKHSIPLDMQSEPASRKVLIVNGEKEMQDMLAESLKQYPEKLAVFTAGNCFEAGTIMGIHRPDLVILDLIMPGIDGAAVTKMVRGTAAFKHSKILALVDSCSEGNSVRANEIGADICLARPIDQSKLSESFRSLMDVSRAIRAPKRNKLKRK